MTAPPLGLAADDRPGAHPRPAVAVLGWLVRAQWRTIVLGAVISCLFLGTQQLIPYIVGRALDEGVVAGDADQLHRWTLALAAVVGMATLSGILSHIVVIRSIVDAILRSQKCLVESVLRIGSPLHSRVDRGEVVTIAASDAFTFGMFVGNIGMLCASLFAFGVAVTLLASQSWMFVLAVGVGMPAMFAALRPIFLRLEARQDVLRQRIAEQTDIATDAVAGLRVLRGVGGEAHFVRRYRDASRATLRAGVRAGHTGALLAAAQTVLPGVLLIALLWLGIRLALAGTISAGQFAALFGYLIFLTRPLAFTIMTVDALTKAVVASRRLTAVTGAAEAVQPGSQPGGREPQWPEAAPLIDPTTGVVVEPGRLTGVTATSAGLLDGLLDRLSGLEHPSHPARIGDLELTSFPTRIVRQRIHLLSVRTRLFSGNLREQLDVDGSRSDTEIMAALHAASAVDIVGVDPSRLEDDAPPSDSFDLDLVVEERGRNYSGGERQRLLLARSLLTRADILLLDDPASACDAQTEARIADRLARHRAGSTTVVVTSAPQLLASCDRIVFLGDGDGGTAIIEGTHAELIRHAEYRRATSR
ncbi:ABC transporter ATP-binding protein/permease [Glycomyces sp. L485]|uniref:ABC transporter transmembrane domain-containing protein n=1 Tax=Glycomyces sp. L485 TaxID=2909235 RepID=UPI001F4AA196|nr:ABC transporter ATP-binding protein [Glycomyces sp. L485]MCH7231771.1 ABC transporter ATP-binding protein/permease [Glycomyces sp. L485]